MTSANQNGPGPGDQLLDLLVDGELNENERRKALASLDRMPDGWRRCALAFLEAQCWKEDFCGILPTPDEKPEPSLAGGTGRDRPPSPPAVRRRFGAGRWGTWLAVAATFFVALGIGTQIRPPWRDQSSEGSLAREPARVAQDMRAEALPGAGGQSFAKSSRGTWEQVTLATANSDEPVRLPARQGDCWDERCWHGGPALPEELLQALERAGHQVRHSRQFVPMLLEDGRHLIVPVDQIDVRYQGAADYQ